MIIKELNIVEFGCMRARVITPAQGMNIVQGDNESGKSTVMLFIKFMLYGLGRKTATNTDRERSVSWGGHTASGSMTVEHGGEDYRIERRFVDGGRETCAVVRLGDGERIANDKTPGEYFLGVPKEVFESSACVGQMLTAKIDGEKTASGIANMLSSADESVDTAAIVKRLDNVRVEYRHKTKNGGSLYEAEQKMASLRQRLEKAREGALALEVWTQKLENAKDEYARTRRELEEIDAMLAQLGKVTLIKRFERLRRSAEDIAQLEKGIGALESDTLYTQYLPDSRHVAELGLAARTLRNAQERVERAREAFENSAVRGYDDHAAHVGEEIEKSGGADRLRREIKAKRDKLRMQNRVIATVWICAALLVLCGVGLFVMSGSLLGLLPAVAVIPAILLSVICGTAKRRAASEIAKLAEAYGFAADSIEESIDECMRALALYRVSVSERARIETEQRAANDALIDARTHAEELLIRTRPELEVSAQTLLEEQRRLESFIADRDQLYKRRDAMRMAIASEEKDLKNYDEAALRSEITVDIEEVTSMTVSETERQQDFLSKRLQAAERKVDAISNSVMQQRMSVEDPLPIADELCELEASYAGDSAFFDALVLAMSAIEEAGQTMSKSVTPVIARRASELMDRISAGRYTTVRTTGALGLSLDSDGFGVKADLLSGGTRDAAYLALRIALFERIYGADRPPLLLDESLCQMDDDRAARFVEMLCELADTGIQCFCFTSHKRESEFCDRMGTEYKKISI